MQEKLILLAKDFGGIMGKFAQNVLHRHFTVQLTVSDYAFTLYTEPEIIESKHVIIASNVEHQIKLSPEQQVLVLNTNPISELGYWCKCQLNTKKAVTGDSSFFSFL